MGDVEEKLEEKLEDKIRQLKRDFGDDFIVGCGEVEIDYEGSLTKGMFSERLGELEDRDVMFDYMLLSKGEDTEDYFVEMRVFKYGGDDGVEVVFLEREVGVVEKVFVGMGEKDVYDEVVRHLLGYLDHMENLVRG